MKTKEDLIDEYQQLDIEIRKLHNEDDQIPYFNDRSLTDEEFIHKVSRFENMLNANLKNEKNKPALVFENENLERKYNISKALNILYEKFESIYQQLQIFQQQERLNNCTDLDIAEVASYIKGNKKKIIKVYYCETINNWSIIVIYDKKGKVFDEIRISGANIDQFKFMFDQQVRKIVRKRNIKLILFSISAIVALLFIRYISNH